MQTSTTSRRALLAGLAAIPVAAAPALPASNPDAALLSLAPEFDRLHHAVAAMRPQYKAGEKIFEEAMAAASDRFDHRHDKTDGGFIDVYSAVMRESGFKPVLDAYEDLHEPLDWLSDKIGKAPPPQTLEGLALKARVLGLAFARAWDKDPGRLDWDELLVRQVVENACALAGVDRLGRPLA
jgi:hypothetical protein